jgi:hypothetical protein
MLAIWGSVEGTYRIHGVEHVSKVGCGRRGESSDKTLVAERTNPVSELGSARWRVDDCGALEQASSVETKQTSLCFMDTAVDESREL